MSTIKTATINFDDEHFVACYQGAQFDVSFTWTDISGTPRDLSAYTAKMQVRNTYKNDLICELSTENGKITLSDQGVINLIIPFSETALLPQGLYVYDFKLFDSEGIPQVPFRGRFVITGAVTL